MQILHCSLLDFLEKKESTEVNFAKITHECGATDFTETDMKIDWKRDRSIITYKFNADTIDSEQDEGSLFVAYIENSSYLMYQKHDAAIFVWVCYTVEKERNKGRMMELLNFLKSSNTDKKIIIDTFDESLIRRATAIGIKQFTNRIKRANQ
jgi:hypothetical protein